METQEALKIIRTLADGVDPHTGAMLQERSPYQDVKTVRALYTIIELVERAQRTEPCIPDSQSGKAWSKAEDERLCREFHDAIDFNEIARIHGRTRWAIFTRLTKLGQIKPKKPPFNAG